MASAPTNPLLLVCGEDDFAVKQRARQVYAAWTAELGGMDHETIDANVANGNEALKMLARLREALQTLPFFGSGKVIWFQTCNFLAEERSATTDVTENLAQLAQDLKAFDWRNVRLLISALKVDKRKIFYKAIDKTGVVETFAGWSVDDKDWSDRAEMLVRETLVKSGKTISEEAVAELVNRVGPLPRQLSSETEKVSLFAGARANIEKADVEAVCSQNKMARAFALGDALGDRNLPALLRRLDEELWETKLNAQKSEIGLLYGLISKVRSLVLLKEMVREGWVKPGSDYPRFKAQLSKISPDDLPSDKRYNPLAIHPFVLWKGLAQVERYTLAELVNAMEILLGCNQKLVTSGLDETLVLQQALVQIAGGQPADRPTARQSS